MKLGTLAGIESNCICCKLNLIKDFLSSFVRLHVVFIFFGDWFLLWDAIFVANVNKNI